MYSHACVLRPNSTPKNKPRRTMICMPMCASNHSYMRIYIHMCVCVTWRLHDMHAHVCLKPFVHAHIYIYIYMTWNTHIIKVICPCVSQTMFTCAHTHTHTYQMRIHHTYATAQSAPKIKNQIIIIPSAS
jgi:hypothetical protein